ncbi:DNA-dependent ATPase protein rad54 [Lunasporangiospora selenospora]|uniref:DNA-dependent ATPase protein rad54 n=1 Tax=Lunasporangiospora selenospora TaxID=979761 RepID=A0A9P6KCQ8_9FUNG|nr:DNA-dependent ATPase protein rad54 [Lunasporangiospora selenospora]
MNRTFSGISLKRPLSKPSSTPPDESVDANCTEDNKENISTLDFASNSISPTHSKRDATKSTEEMRLKSVIIEVAPIPITPVGRPILKKNPGSKSPTHKKVEFVDDSEGSLSDPDDYALEDADHESTLKCSSSPPQVVIPLAFNDGPDSFNKSSEPTPTEVTPRTAEYSTDSLGTLPKAPLVAKTQTRTNPMAIKLSIKPRPAPKAIQIDLSDDESDRYDEENGSESGSDDDTFEAGMKKQKTGRLTHKMIKASLPKPTSRTTRSGRTGSVPLKVTISKKPLLALKPAQPTDRSLATLGKKFRVPTFKVPGMAPEPTRQGAFNLGVKQRPPVEGRCAHDYTMEGSIILHDPAWEKLDEAKMEEERLLCASQEKSRTDEEDDTPQVIIPKKEKKSKSIAEILGLVKPKEVPKVHVMVDPVLGRVLRPHQVEGVKFMYKCVTGGVLPNVFGCIMADEMGLGKTLQCITLLWTLLKQSPDPGKGTIEKCIICCPSSLVKNWANEIVKWLGPGKIGVLTCDANKTKDDTNNAMRRWASARQRMVVNPVLIISYESLRMYAPVLAQSPIGLMLCDEGHRLKNSNSQTFVALNELNVQRRVILSGTPVQNDLSEYFSLLNFANPGLLGSTAEFRKNFELPILRGRDSEATDREQEVSNQKLAELSSVVSRFIIRRTNDILSKYLPTKFEHVVFCKLAPMQLGLYSHFINSKSIQRLLRGNGSQPLKAIGLLKKLCNHPDLLDLPDDLEGCESILPPDYILKGSKKQTTSRGGVLVQSEFSGKMLVLERMLAKIRNETNDKIVLISNYTQTLDIFEKLCRQNQYGVLRLDGTMTINKRQKLVDRFNNPDGHEFVFLLSSKAGGCGLNLIGANRLILFDPDWNPAADQQALARVWRDGQKKDCFVYRFIATGSIEEKIFQRQSHKQSLSSCVVDEDQDVERHFSQENLRQLFQFNADTECCDTHETFKCKRCVDGRQVMKAAQVSYGDTSTWNHFKGDQDLLKLPDPLLKAEADTGAVSFVFQYISH